MKQLLLIRHGKSSWDFPGRSDHDRPLNDRGRDDAPRVAQALLQRGVRPDAFVSSTATRAASTAGLLAEEMGFPASGIVEKEELYLASPRTILSLVQQLDEGLETVLVFGHNPGMHEAVEHITSDSSVHTFPTLAVARIELKVEFWGEVDEGSGLLLELLLPRSLRSG
ncbi:MAG: histidine phosphatase family protein [Verrucomicrobiales bacterium]|nr:histidine phosphatase family protein [Verrucomicrobiales bacterium]